MANIKPPDTFNWEERNLKKAWDEWYQEFTLYVRISRFRGEGVDEAARTVDIFHQKKSLLMYLIGKKGREIYSTLRFKDEKNIEVPEETATLSMINNAFKEYCEPRKSIFVDRVTFLRREQESSESIEQFILALQTMAKSCDWDNVSENDMIVLAILKGIKDKALRSALLRETTLDYDKCARMCRATDYSENTGNILDDVPDGDTINTVNKFIQNCMFCHNKQKHLAGKCPAKGKQCNVVYLVTFHSPKHAQKEEDLTQLSQYHTEILVVEIW